MSGGIEQGGVNDGERRDVLSELCSRTLGWEGCRQGVVRCMWDEMGWGVCMLTVYAMRHAKNGNEFGVSCKWPSLNADHSMGWVALSLLSPGLHCKRDVVRGNRLCHADLRRL